ncbi:hypothetical protein N5079_30045 [Planotetraspora sp. A-T 1434]|uniref:hypothetical protein n=1 Tax=Planotetraspora sp. A-T 1434 TaxID=2979219 RepID=UPI0021C12BC2|nr:hypothetical protein [Planotetraspora sp. A-T 1434]MCT9934455.1 hypothetical protein [Planotetraspora sp. A-T 1434]
MTDEIGYYFAYCTWLDPRLLKARAPSARVVTLGRAHNRRVEFRRSADSEGSKGWCHLSDTGDAWGRVAYGAIIEMGLPHDARVFAANGARFLSVYGDDGAVYDCWTYCLNNPGEPMKVPDYEWDHILTGIEAWTLPRSYGDELRATYDAAEACPDPGRANPVPLSDE